MKDGASEPYRSLVIEGSTAVFFKIRIESVIFFPPVNKHRPSIKPDVERMHSTACLFIQANCQFITQRLKFERKRENVLLDVDLGERMNGGRRGKPLKHDSVTL